MVAGAAAARALPCDRPESRRDDGAGIRERAPADDEVRQALRGGALLAGDAAKRLPDLVVSWRPLPYSGPVVSARFGAVAREGVGSGRTGNHTDGDAWAVVAPGASTPSEPSRTPSVTAIAATAATVTGAPVDGLAGEPLLER